MLVSIWRTMLSLWLLCVLLVISLPWSNFDGIAHWKNVQWVPFGHLSFHPAVMVETALNLIAFIPVGYLGVRSFLPNSQPFFFAALLGFCASFSIEAYQLFCHDRVPSTTDIIMNVSGTSIGVYLAFAIDHIFSFFVVQVRRLTA
jgi:glycopeptide antibiotics resistance protein